MNWLRASRIRAKTLTAAAVTAAVVGLSTSPTHADYTARPSFAAQAQDDNTTDDPVVEEVPDGYVEVSTVPVVPNVEVEIDGNSGVTDEEGKVLIEVEEPRGVIERIDVKTRIVGLGEGWEATWQRNYRLGHRRYAMAFSRHMPVSFSFFGTNGEVIEREVIDSMTLKSSLGAVVEDVPLDRPIILHGDRVVSTQRGPEVREVEWSVESLIVRDTNVVNRSQVRFTPSTVDHVDVPLLFFAADFSVHDMFFLIPILGQIELTLPNGDVELHDLDEDGRLHLESMPRGEYKVLVLGPGPNIARPVVLSRNQTLDLEFLSWLDITVVGVSLVLFLIAPLIVGRRFLRRRSRRRARAYLSENVKQPETYHGRDVVTNPRLEGLESAAVTTSDYSDDELASDASTTQTLEGLVADWIEAPESADGPSPNGNGVGAHPDDRERPDVDAELSALVVLGVLDDSHGAAVGDAHDAGSLVGDDGAELPVGAEESSADDSEPTATRRPNDGEWAIHRTANGDDPEHAGDEYSTDSVNR